MPKYKYVDGVKYRVVPQSVLGYALVKEDSDNSLPSGGTEGQVLAKASDADYDVEWTTVESGGGSGVETFLIEIEYDNGEYDLANPEDLETYFTNVAAGKVAIFLFNLPNNGRAYIPMVNYYPEDTEEETPAHIDGAATLGIRENAPMGIMVTLTNDSGVPISVVRFGGVS